MSQEYFGREPGEMTVRSYSRFPGRRVIARRAGRSGLRIALTAVSLAFVSCVAGAQQYDAGSPCTGKNPSDRCIDYEAAIQVDPGGGRRPNSALPDTTIPRSEPSLLMVGSTLMGATAQPAGMEFATDTINAAIGELMPHPFADTPADPVEEPGDPVEDSGDPVADDSLEAGAKTDENSLPSKPFNPLYRQYLAPAQLSPEPLPDTIGRVAWRFVPVGVQIDLSALGAYVNSPVYQWDVHDLSVSPKSALGALLPTGYCLDEGEFPTVRVIVCGDDETDSRPDGIIVDHHDDATS